MSADSSDVEPTDEEVRAQIVAELLASVSHVQLTVEELTALTSDLGLALPLGGARPVASSSGGPLTVDVAAARRSLASKRLITLDSDGPVLAPWLNVMVDAVDDPLLVIEMRRSTRTTSYEWTLFIDDHLGVQQQGGEDGVVAWAPFRADETVDIMLDALGFRLREQDVDPVSFTVSLEELARMESDADAGQPWSGESGPQSVYSAGLGAAERSTQMVNVEDRTGAGARQGALAWVDLDEAGCWQITVIGDDPHQARATLERRPVQGLLHQMLALLPVDADDVLRLAAD